MGSAFWHGSHTYAGNVADNRVIEVLSYLAHQATLDRLGPFVANNPVLTDLSLTKRPYSALEINDQLNDMFLNQPPSEWAATINGFDMPNYYMTFAGLVSTVFSVALEPEQADPIIDSLIDLFSFPEAEGQFLKEHYLPEVRSS